MDSLLKTFTNKNILIFSGIIIFSLVFILSAFFVSNLSISLLLIIVAMTIPFYFIIRAYFIYQTLESFVNKASNKLDIRWIKDGKIETLANSGVIKGVAQIKDKSFIAGVKLSTDGVFIQFISVRPLNVVLFSWESIEYVQQTTLIKGHAHQVSAVFKLLSDGTEFVLPWDTNFDYLIGIADRSARVI
ncbi:hypothetical protein [Glaciecola sp. SC05]|uniref:hypothetical protein n=1 Tax=Glaciecola sp. SC05 TaxID=1987355 RepID=UPI003527ECB2